MKIAYTTKQEPQVRRTVTVDLKPSHTYRMAYKQTGTTQQPFLMGEELFDKLTDDIWPDVPLNVYIPVYNPPAKWAYVLKDPPPRPESNDNRYKRIVSPEYIAYLEAYKAQLDQLETVMRSRLVIVHGWIEPLLPHEDCQWWSVVDRKYTPIAVDPTLYLGRTFWREAEADLWDRFITKMMLKPNPVKWIAYKTLIHYAE